MCQPEEDFPTWLMILQSTTDNVEDFNRFIPDIERLLDSIVKTDDLPEPIKDFKIEFITKLHTDIIRRFQNFGYLQESQLDIIFHFFQIVIKFSCYGIKSSNAIIMYLCPSIIQFPDCTLFKNNVQYNFIPKLCEYALECNFLEDGMKSLSELPNSVDVIYYLYFGLHFLIDYTNKVNFWDLSALTLKAIQHNCEEFLRSIPTGTVFSLFSDTLAIAYKHEKIQKEFIDSWLEIITLFVKSDIFEKQLCGLKGISTLISREQSKFIVLEWFRSPENLKIMSGNDMHNEFINPYNTILCELAAADLLTDTFLENLWKLHTVQHSTQLLQFFLIFNMIATKLQQRYMNDYVLMCLKPESETEIWVKFINQLGVTIGKRNDSPEAFSFIREKLFSLSFSGNSSLNISAQQGLLNILQFYLSPQILVEYTNRLRSQCGNTILFYQLLKEATKSSFNDEDFSYGVLRDAILFALQIHSQQGSTVDKPSSVYPFIENVCNSNKISIPENALEDLFSLADTENFYPFIINLIKGGFVSYDYVEHFILNMNPELITEDFFDLVKEFIYKVNNYPLVLKKLPIEKEEILWVFSTTESKCRNLFTNLLCELYSKNDGIELSDHLMIRTFFEKWNVMRQTRNQNLILNVMKCFIVTIESYIDVSFYDVTRHDPSLYLNTVIVNVSGQSLPSPQTHEVPESMLVSALKHRISRTAMKPMNKFRITMNQNYLNELDTIKTIANGNKAINVSIKLLDNDKYTPEYHERTCVPSALISQSFISDSLIDMLKENNEDAKKLLDYLPTNINTLMQIDEIEKKQHFDYNQLLPVEYPFFFTYNLEALKKKLDYDNSSNGELFKSFERTGGFIFLAENANSPNLMKSIVPFLEKELTIDLKKNLGQKLFDAIFPSLLVDKPQKRTFIANANFLTNIASTCEIKLPEEFYQTIGKILFSSKKYVKNYGNNLLAKVKIPLNVFLEKMDENNQDVILYACYHHIDAFNPLFHEMFIKNPHSYALLLIIKKNLDDNLIEDDQIKLQIVHILIANYLTIDSRPKDKNCFSLALECLSLLKCPDLFQQLQDLFNKKIQPKEWRIDGDSTAVSSTGFSGLINLGATCFLNSTLQQFFAIPPLRKSIIEYNGEDPFMIQLRNLFARMWLSKGHPVSTEELVKEWTGWDGEKMNPRVQQDACEFVQILIDKLEKGLGKEFIQSLFAGTTVDNIEGISEEYHATRNQPFYTFTMPIKDLTNVEEALYAMQNPDFLTGANQYHADQLDRKIDAKKFQKIGSLPPYFIVQLSRFTYDYNTWERSKIDSQFEFPVNLDLSMFTCVDNQIARYKLRGVIIHCGNALCGHYISYVSDRASGHWLCCNDSHVSEISEEDVLNDAYGKYQYKNAYLLFYDREDTQKCNDNVQDDQNQQKSLFSYTNDISISDELKEIIEKENKLNDQYSLFCSSPFYEFCKSLSCCDDINYGNIALRYYYEIFPYTTHVDKTEEFAFYLIRAVNQSDSFRNVLASYLPYGYFQSALVYCPSDRLRKHTLSMLDALEPNQYSDSFLAALIAAINDLVSYIGMYSEYFELIERVISKSENAALFATSNNWVTRLSAFITEDIPKFLTDNPTFRPTYIYSVINIDGLFRTIASLNPPENLVTYILDQEFFKLLLYNPRHPVDASSIVDLLRSFSNFEEVKNFISHFTVHCGIYVDPFKLLRIIYNVLREDSFDLISQSILKTKDDMDFAASLAGEAMYEMQTGRNDFHLILLSKMDKWLLKYLINDNSNCRICALYTVAFLVPCKSFNGLISFPATNASSLYGEISFSIPEENNYQPSQEVMQRAQYILSYLIDHVDNVADKIAELSTPFPGIDYIDCIIRLSKFIQFDVSNFFIDFASNRLRTKCPFDIQKKEILLFLSENYPQLVTMDFIIKMMDYPTFTETNNELSSNSSLYNNRNTFIRALKFLEALECLADSLQPPPEFVESFVTQLAFTPFQHYASSYKTISTFVVKFASIYPSIFIDYIRKNLSTVAIYCYSLLLVTLETTKTKMPILPYLASAATTKKQFFTLDELILKSFELNEETEEDEDDKSFEIAENVNENVSGFAEEDEASNSNNNNNNNAASNSNSYKEMSSDISMDDEEEDEYEEESQKQVHPYKTEEEMVIPIQNKIEINNELNINTKSDDQRIQPLISLLNSPQIGHDARQAIWNLILIKKPSYPAFKMVFNWRGDWPEFTTYLLTIAPTLLPQNEDENDDEYHCKHEKYKELIDDLIECSKNSAESFSLAEDFLFENALNEVMKRGFSDYLFKLDIGNNVDAFAKYLNVLFDYIKNNENVDSDDVFLKKCQDAIQPLIVAVDRRVCFLVDVFEDVRDGAIGKTDLIPLFSPLQLLCTFKNVIVNTKLVNDLVNLQRSCNNVDVINRVEAKDELRKLSDLISNVI